MPRPRVLLADDHVMFIELLGNYLSHDFDLVGVATDGEDLLRAARLFRPDVIVADMTMPKLSGIEALRELKASGIVAKVVFLTMHDEPELASEALHQGAAGYVLKHCAGEELIKAIHEALAGRIFVSPRIAGAAFQAMSNGNGQSLGSLTKRQRDVLALVAQGKTHKQIAASLNLSQRTVESHKYEMMHTLGVQSTAELVHFAIRRGIVAV